MDEPAGQGESGTASGGIIVRPGEGRTIPGTDVITLVATTEQTGGSIGVFEDISSPGEGHHAMFTTAQTSYSTSFRETSSSWSASTKKACRLGSMSSSLGGGPRLQGDRDRAGEDALGVHPRGPGAGLRGVRQGAHRGRRGESERAPQQECGADEQDVCGDKREVRLGVRGTIPVGLRNSRTSEKTPFRHLGE